MWFTNFAGETEVTLHVPPDMRMGTVASYAVQHLLDTRCQLLGSSIFAAEGPLIRVITQQGLDIGANKLCRAWLIGSKCPGSVVPKWIEGKHGRRARVFDNAGMVARRQAMARQVVAEAARREVTGHEAWKHAASQASGLWSL